MARRVYSFAPGRTELAGNHTDHQGGKTLSASVTCGIKMRLEATGDGCAHVRSAGFEPLDFPLSSLGPVPGEVNTTAALVRGVAAGLRERGVEPDGFEALVSSTIPAGGGLSSSAAFELALATGLDLLFGHGKMSALERAHIGAQAERRYFGKPCGLQDQSVIAHGGILELDFARPDEPALSPIAFDFAACGHAVVLIETGCNHSAFTDEFAGIVEDMRSVAHLLGAELLGELDEHVFFDSIALTRSELGDRAMLRALHYFCESRLVKLRAAALREHDMKAFLDATRRSAVSSAQYLQNVSVPDSAEQPAMVALALADVALAGRGAVRVHGGGFGGTVQAFVPLDMLDPFVGTLERSLGPQCCNTLTLTETGACARWI